MRSLIKEQYINALYGKDNKILQEIRSTAPEKKSHIQIASYEGAIIAFFASMIKAKNILEIGTFVGYSAACMAFAVPDAKILSIEKNDHHYDIAKHNIEKHNLKERINVIKGDALIIMRNMDENSMDFIFIDGTKSEYPLYLDESIRIVRHGGMIMADNTMLFDNVYLDKPNQNIHAVEMWDNIRRFNSKIADEEIFQTIFLPTASGMTVAVKK